MAAQWYYDERGEKRGPVSASALARLARTGRVGPQTLVQCEGRGKWVPARKVKGLFGKTKERRGAAAPAPPVARGVSPPPGGPAAPSPKPPAPSPLNPNGGARQSPSSRRRRVYVASAGLLLLALLAWALMAGVGAGERRGADRDAGQGSGGRVRKGEEKNAEKKSADPTGDRVTMSRQELQDVIDGAVRAARDRDKEAGASKAEREKQEAEKASKAAKERARRAIQRLLEEDRRVAKATIENFGDGDKGAKYAVAIREYCAHCEKTDTTDCPATVLVAYRRHLDAWTTYAKGAAENGTTEIGSFVYVFRLDAKFKQSSIDIVNTWHDVTDRAAEYGVVLER